MDQGSFRLNITILETRIWIGARESLRQSDAYASRVSSSLPESSYASMTHPCNYCFKFQTRINILKLYNMI